MRIFWAFNDQWLIKNEVPMLVRMGHSVYIPKIPEIKVNACVTYDYDEDLMIDKEKLEQLNQCDFYGRVCGRDILSICNQYFDAAIIDYSRCLLEAFLLYFKGVLVLRPTFCGKMDDTQKIYDDIGFWALHRIMKKKNSFFIARLDHNLIHSADTLSNGHMLRLPCIPLETKRDSSGGSGILYICDGIKTYPQVYENYLFVRKQFRTSEITFMGKQIIAEEDGSGIHMIDASADYSGIIVKYACLLYLSTEEKELPLYLFDALQMGVPVVFLPDGVLDSVIGTKAAGRCKTLKEAAKLCRRLSRNHELGKKIAEQQGREYARFLNTQKKACEELQQHIQHWIKEKNEKNAAVKVPRIGVVMPNAYTGGVLDYTERLIYAIKMGAVATGKNVEIVFGYMKHPVYEQTDYFKKIRELGVQVREYFWENLSVKRIKTSYLYQGYDLHIQDTKYIALNDGMSYFEDCDFLLFTADRVGGRLYSNIPYGMILHDYIQRYVPGIMRKNNYEEQLPFMESARGALSCFTTTEDIRQEAIMYAGIDQSRVHLIPLFFGDVNDQADKQVPNSSELKKEGIFDYFLWSTNTARHKNHPFALEALLKYYEGGGSLKCVITGANTDKFDITNELREKDEYIEEIRGIFKDNLILQENIIIKGNLPKQRYFQVLSKAKYFLNTSCNDNGNGTAFDAAMLGVRTLSCDYAAMRNMDRVTSMQMSFYENNNVDDAVMAMKNMEKSIGCIMMPSREELRKHVVTDNESLCSDIYKVISRFLPC